MRRKPVQASTKYDPINFITILEADDTPEIVNFNLINNYIHNVCNRYMYIVTLRFTVSSRGKLPLAITVDQSAILPQVVGLNPGQTPQIFRGYNGTPDGTVAINSASAFSLSKREA
jgi:hypothetical protein